MKEDINTNFWNYLDGTRRQTREYIIINDITAFIFIVQKLELLYIIIWNNNTSRPIVCVP